MEKIAALLRRRQFKWLRNIRTNSSKTWRELGQFSRVVPHPPTEIIQACRLRQIAFNDLGEGEIGKRFVSFVAVPDEASEANARRVLRHLDRQAGPAHGGSAPGPHQRPVPPQGAIPP